MDSAARAEGRQRVRQYLWDRLDQAGMTRPRGMTVDQVEAMRKRVTERLAYMDTANLMTLAEIIIRHAQGKPPTACWAEALILTEARALQTPPPDLLPVVTSWLASVEGPQAIAAGHAVELYHYLIRTGRPPKPADFTTPGGIRDKAAANMRKETLVRDQIARGVAQPDDRKWLQWYEREKAAVARIVDAGQARRDANAASQGDAA